MTPEDLKPENVGRTVLIDAIGPYENCKATFRAWERNQRTIICSLDAPYGVGNPQGKLLELPLENARFAPNDRVTPLPGLASK